MSSSVVRVDFIPEVTVEKLSLPNRLDLILDSVANNKVVVIEKALEPQEELALIQKTMERVDADKFTGIKLFSLKSKVNNGKSFFSKTKELTFSVIAPSDAVQVTDINGILSLSIAQ